MAFALDIHFLFVLFSFQSIKFKIINLAGKIPLADVDHYENWCEEAQKIFNDTGKIPDFNDKVILMQYNASNIKYDPYQSGTYTPLTPCKGVYSRQVIKKKPKYSSEFRNESVFETFTNTGTTYNVKDPHTGIGIICYEDMLNILGAHRAYSQDTDDMPKASMTKLFLMFREVTVEKEDIEPWDDVWDLVMKKQLETDTMYTGSMTLGPNFNPRPETVQVINMPTSLEDDEIHRVSYQSHVDKVISDQHADMAHQVREEYPIGESATTVPPDLPDRMDETETTELNLPLDNETFAQWVTRNGHLTESASANIQLIFKDAIKLMDSNNNNPTFIISSAIMSVFNDLYDTQLLSRRRSEKMFSDIEPITTNPYLSQIPGQSHQLVFDHRFRPFIESKLGTSQTLLTYTSQGLDPDALSTVLNFDQLKTVKTGKGDAERDIKVFHRHGDLLRMMFANVNNGKTFSDLIKLTSLFIEFYSMKLAATEISYPSYSYFMNKASPANWRNEESFAEITPPFQDRKLSVFENPDFEHRVRACESLLTWHALMSLILSYVKHDRTDIRGLSGTQCATDFMESDAVTMVFECPASLASGMCFFDRFFDSPLLCQYGELGGLNGNKNSYYKLTDKNFVQVGEQYRGGLIVKYSQEIEPSLDDPDLGNLLKFDRSLYSYWTFLLLTYDKPMGRTKIGRELLEWNEIFRGERMSMNFLKVVGKKHFHDSMGNPLHSDKLIEVPRNTDVFKVLGIAEIGRNKQSTLQRLIATHDLLHEISYNSYAPNGQYHDYWKNYHNMFAKQAVWGKQFEYANYIAPNLPPWEWNHGDQSTYNPLSDYDKTMLHKYTLDEKEHIYYLPTGSLATQTFNHSDYLLTGGSFTLKGSGMSLINTVIPYQDLTWYNTLTDNAKLVFQHEPAENGSSYMSVLRPFGKYIWVNDDEINLIDFFNRPYFRLGNRPSITSIPELED